MILDRLDHAKMHCALGAEIAMAIDYLRRTDFSKLANGRYELDGDRVYAIVQRYKTKPQTEAKWEAHRQYLDIQYVVEGNERMGYAFLHDKMPVEKEYDAEKDYALYHATGDFLAVPAGSFAIFAPHDVHSPGVATGGPESVSDVCKVVVKCRVATA
jgi:YhcH/YjgK/YiaL family protein